MGVNCEFQIWWMYYLCGVVLFVTWCFIAPWYNRKPDCMKFAKNIYFIRERWRTHFIKVCHLVRIVKKNQRCFSSQLKIIVYVNFSLGHRYDLVISGFFDVLNKSLAVWFNRVQDYKILMVDIRAAFLIPLRTKVSSWRHAYHYSKRNPRSC